MWRQLPCSNRLWNNQKVAHKVCGWQWNSQLYFSSYKRREYNNQIRIQNPLGSKFECYLMVKNLVLRISFLWYPIWSNTTHIWKLGSVFGAIKYTKYFRLMKVSNTGIKFANCTKKSSNTKKIDYFDLFIFKEHHIWKLGFLFAWYSIIDTSIRYLLKLIFLIFLFSVP